MSKSLLIPLLCTSLLSADLDKYSNYISDIRINSNTDNATIYKEICYLSEKEAKELSNKIDREHSDINAVFSTNKYQGIEETSLYNEKSVSISPIRKSLTSIKNEKGCFEITTEYILPSQQDIKSAVEKNTKIADNPYIYNPDNPSIGQSKEAMNIYKEVYGDPNNNEFKQDLSKLIESKLQQGIQKVSIIKKEKGNGPDRLIIHFKIDFEVPEDIIKQVYIQSKKLGYCGNSTNFNTSTPFGDYFITRDTEKQFAYRNFSKDKVFYPKDTDIYCNKDTFVKYKIEIWSIKDIKHVQQVWLDNMNRTDALKQYKDMYKRNGEIVSEEFIATKYGPNIDNTNLFKQKFFEIDLINYYRGMSKFSITLPLDMNPKQLQEISTFGIKVTR